MPPPPAPHPVPGDSRTRWEERDTQEVPKTTQAARGRQGGYDARDGGGGGLTPSCPAPPLHPPLLKSPQGPPPSRERASGDTQEVPPETPGASPI